MKKMLTVVLVSSLLLAGCSDTLIEVSKAIDEARNNPNAYPVTNQVVIQNKGLEGCVYQRIVPDNSVPVLNVIRCPNSSTTTTWNSGKTTQSATVIEGASVAQTLNGK